MPVGPQPVGLNGLALGTSLSCSLELAGSWVFAPQPPRHPPLTPPQRPVSLPQIVRNLARKILFCLLLFNVLFPAMVCPSQYPPSRSPWPAQPLTALVLVPVTKAQKPRL